MPTKARAIRRGVNDRLGGAGGVLLDPGVITQQADARAISATNLFTDPRATTMSHFTATAPSGTITQNPTNRVDGYQQLASPLSCVEVVATPAAASYVGIQETTGLMGAGSGFNLKYGQSFLATRCAFKVVSVVGGGTWHVALVLNYYAPGNVKQGEVTIWTESGSRITTGQWYIAEGFDNQLTNSSVTWADLELRVYNDSGTPGAVTLRMTEIVETVDADGDVPYYVGGDLAGAAPRYAQISGAWLGTADASQSTLTYDPAAYPPSEFGFNDYSTVNNYVSAADAIALQLEMGATVCRAPAQLSGGNPGNPTLDAQHLAYIQQLIAAGIKILFATSAPAWMLPGGVWPSPYGWPTTNALQTQFANSVVAAIEQVGAQHVWGVIVGNEPNNPTYGGTSGPTDQVSYSAYLSAITSAVHAAFPNIKVLGGTLSAGGTVPPTNGVTADTFLAGMYTNAAQYDVLDIHPYPIQSSIVNSGTTFRAGSSAPSAAGWTTNYGLDQGFDATLRQIKDRMTANSDTRPLFASEAGQLTAGSNGAERLQGQVEALIAGRLRRDPRFLGVCFNSVVDKVPNVQANGDWGPVDPRTLRRRPAARNFALMRGRRRTSLELADVEQAFTAWKMVRYGITQVAAGAAAATLILYPGGGIPLGNAASAFGAFWLDPADYGAFPRIVQARVRLVIAYNATPAGVTVTATLSPVATWNGATTARTGVATLGTPVSTVQSPTSAAGPGVAKVDGVVGALTGAQAYVLTLQTSAATAASSDLEVNVTADVRSVI